MHERSIFDRLLNPHPYTVVDLTGLNEADSLAQSNQWFHDCFCDANAIYIRNNFMKFQPYQVKDGVVLLHGFISTAFWRSKQLDASRSIGNILMSFYLGKRHLSSYSQMLRMSIEEHVGLGDGQSVYTRGQGWSFSQKNGQYQNTSEFIALSPW